MAIAAYGQKAKKDKHSFAKFSTIFGIICIAIGLIGLVFVRLYSTTDDKACNRIYNENDTCDAEKKPCGTKCYPYKDLWTLPILGWIGFNLLMILFSWGDDVVYQNYTDENAGIEAMIEKSRGTYYNNF